MSLDRNDFRGKLDPAWRELMRAVADAEEVSDAEWIEALIVRELQKRAHVASVIAEAARRAGITWNRRESPGVPGNAGE